METIAPPVEPPEPAPAEQPEVPLKPNETFKPSRINLEELAEDSAPSVGSPVDLAVDPNPAPPVDSGAPAPPAVDLEGLFSDDKPVETVAPPTDPAAPPVEIEPTDVPSQLRKQLKEQKKQFEEERAALEAKATTSAEEAVALRGELQVQDPLITLEVVEAKTALETEIGKVAKTLSNPAEARRFLESAKTMSDAYGELGDIYSDGYDERHAMFRQNLEQNFGDSSDVLLRAMPEIDELRSSMDKAVESANSNSMNTIQQRQLQSHDDHVKMFRNAVATTLTFNDQLKEVDPYAAQNVIAKMTEVLPSFNEGSKDLLKSLEQAMTPPRPILPEDAPSLTPTERGIKEQERFTQYQHDSAQVLQLVPLAFHALRALPFFAEGLATEKAKTKALSRDSPNPSTNLGAQVRPYAPVQSSDPQAGPRRISKEELLG